MVEEINTFNTFISRTINMSSDFFNSVIPDELKPYIILGTFIVFVTIYSIFIWKFYKFFARRDLLELNLSQYNKYEHDFTRKFFAILLFILEYIIILPIVTFFWFFVVTLILFLLAPGQNISNILLISAVLVGVVRITSYYSENLSEDLAKLFPLTILVVAISTPGFFNLENILSKLSSITSLFTNILLYLLVIMILEFLLRIFYLAMPDFEED
ncbi:MAG: hypothetical protein QW727_02320 [Candidatus Pacearchaeota archaeon]